MFCTYLVLCEAQFCIPAKVDQQMPNVDSVKCYLWVATFMFVHVGTCATSAM